MSRHLWGIGVGSPSEIDNPFYGDEHLAAHEHGDEMSLPVVNSPRMGVCGYSGPAQPPY